MSCEEDEAVPQAFYRVLLSWGQVLSIVCQILLQMLHHQILLKLSIMGQGWSLTIQSHVFPTSHFISKVRKKERKI
jgi:hypothetical protein